MALIQIDYSRLSDLLGSLKKRLDEQDSGLLDFKQLQTQHTDTATQHGKELKHLNELAIGFQQGLDELHSMSDKVNAWNERFRLIEERNYQIYKELNDVSVSLQTSVEGLRENVESRNAIIITQLQAEISKKHGEGEKNLTARCKDLEEDLEAIKLEQKIGMERLKRDLAEKVKGFYDFMGVMTPNPSFESQSFGNVAEAHLMVPATPSNASRANPLKAIAMKVANLERKLFIDPTFIEAEYNELKEPRGQEDVLFELNHRFAYLAREVENVKTLITIVQAAPTSAQPPKPSPQEIYVSLMDKVNDLIKLKEAAPALLNLEQRVINLTETMNTFNEKTTKSYENSISTPLFLPQRVIRSSTVISGTQPDIRAIEQISSPLLPSSIAIPEKKRAVEAEEPVREENGPIASVNLEAYEKKLEEVYETINKILRTLPQMVNIAEFEELSASVKKISKDRTRDNAKSIDTESAAKQEELEQRLNKLWKQNYDLGNLIQQISSQIERNSQDLIEQQENRIGDVTVYMNSTQGELKKQLDVVVKNIHQMSADFEAKDASNTEQFMKNQLMTLKRDLQETDERLDKLEATLVGQATLLNESDDNLEDMTANLESMSTLQKFQAVLNHHDKSIRVLASRISIGSGIEEAKTRKADSSDVIEHLEDLRIEMHDLQAKYDMNKSLSVKEMEKVNEIYSLLNTKSDRQELGRKVDKTELKRLERLLRKQIEKVNEALKKAEELPQHQRAGEDAFFLKKRLDVDCAACGQLLPNHQDHGHQFAPRERFPVRSAMFGSGFSRLLSSLVPSESGGLTLPRNSSGVMNASDMRSPNTSPPPTGIPRSTPSHAVKRRLPKLKSKASFA